MRFRRLQLSAFRAVQRFRDSTAARARGAICRSCSAPTKRARARHCARCAGSCSGSPERTRRRAPPPCDRAARRRRARRRKRAFASPVVRRRRRQGPLRDPSDRRSTSGCSTTGSGAWTSPRLPAYSASITKISSAPPKTCSPARASPELLFEAGAGGARHRTGPETARRGRGKPSSRRRRAPAGSTCCSRSSPRSGKSCATKG